jgi:hypothetical protein
MFPINGRRFNKKLYIIAKQTNAKVKIAIIFETRNERAIEKHKNKTLALNACLSLISPLTKGLSFLFMISVSISTKSLSAKAPISANIGMRREQSKIGGLGKGREENSSPSNTAIE